MSSKISQKVVSFYFTTALKLNWTKKKLDSSETKHSYILRCFSVCQSVLPFVKMLKSLRNMKLLFQHHTAFSLLKHSLNN